MRDERERPTFQFRILNILCREMALVYNLSTSAVKQQYFVCLSVSSLREVRAAKVSYGVSWTSSVGPSKTIDLSSGARQRRPTVQDFGIRSHTETAEVPETTSRVACPAVKAELQPSAFEAVDIRVGLITDAKAVQDAEMTAKRGKPTLSRKYLQLTVDIGCEERIVVSECKYVMDVEDAVGKKVLIVANVPPTEVLGIQSHGLVLTGVNYDPTPMPRSFKVILPGLGRLPPGAQVREACIP